MTLPAKITLAQWDERYERLCLGGLRQPYYGGKLSRHVLEQKDLRLTHLRYDNSPAALRLWNFVLTENQRLRQARASGERIVGAMKDLGTIPVMAFSLPKLRAFYPDAAWWTPCLMECTDQLFTEAEGLGLDPSFCPVRAMVPAFLNVEHFPEPDLLVCSTGAVCDDFSAIAQHLEKCGHPIFWWEIPRRRVPGPNEISVALPGGLHAPKVQVDCVMMELERVRERLGTIAGQTLSDEMLSAGIQRANRVRALVAELRALAYTAPACPLPALEMLMVEVLAIHFCSDYVETLIVLQELLEEANTRVRKGFSILSGEPVRVFWVNPVADLRVLTALEDWGGRVCGSDYMFTHALQLIPETIPALEALARAALADPMVGSAQERAGKIVADCQKTAAEAVVISRIQGASHCAWEGSVIRDCLRTELQIPTVELEVPSVCDSLLPTLNSRIQAVLETARSRR